MSSGETWHWTDLEAAYLAADNPRGQSGFSGDDARWEMARRVIARGIDRDGTFLDIGCASGYLMETLTRWAAEDDRTIEPYGLDISPALVNLARSRLPQWADRIVVGDAFVWRPADGMRFDFVRTELVYVPRDQQPDFVRHLLNHVVAPGGRLLVCSYGSSRRPAPLVESIDIALRDWGFRIDGVAEAVDPANGIPVTRVVWLPSQPLASDSN